MENKLFPEHIIKQAEKIVGPVKSLEDSVIFDLQCQQLLQEEQYIDSVLGAMSGSH